MSESDVALSEQNSHSCTRNVCSWSFMHTQNQKRRIGTWNWASGLGVGLYLATVVVALACGLVRALLTLFAVRLSELVLPLTLSTNLIVTVAILGPIAYSVVGLRPKRRWSGRVWRLMKGGRRPSESEREEIDRAERILRRSFGGREEDAGTLKVHVRDDEWLAEAVRGDSVFVSRGLLESRYLLAVLAHALGHLDSLDGRLTEALYRLRLWGDVLKPVEGEKVGDWPAEVLLRSMRAAMWVAGGAPALWLMSWPWAWYWRSREYAADAYAVSLGQGPDLRACLEKHSLVFDRGSRGLSRLSQVHPPVAYRLERLDQLIGGAKIPS
jgi:Zn-dependent protease with chaperone function